MFTLCTEIEYMDLGKFTRRNNPKIVLHVLLHVYMYIKLDMAKVICMEKLCQHLHISTTFSSGLAFQNPRDNLPIFFVTRFSK